MAINSPIVAAGPVVTRERAQTVVGRLTSAVPPNPGYSVIDGVLTFVDQYPEKEGQMIFHRNGSELFVTMYVAIVVDYVGDEQVHLEWRPVQNWGFVQDPRTGLEKDPLLDFYSTLAY